MRFLDEDYREVDECGHHLYEMAQMGRVGGFKILVYGGERDIPHFHFENMATRKGGCLKILSAEYYEHGGHNLRLNANERRALVAFLKAPRRDKFAMTNFQSICLAWNINNPDYAIPRKIDDIKIPDYEGMRMRSNESLERDWDMALPKGFI